MSEYQDLQAIQEVRDLLARAKKAQETLEKFSQEEIDQIVFAMVQAGSAASESLARLAVEESGFGRVESKILKNKFSTDGTWEDIRNLKTVGVIGKDEAKGVYEIAEPIGVIAGIVPITNPTSTAMFKCIIALKARNAIVISPHPRGIRCIGESCRILHEAAVAAGAPEGIIGCLTIPTLDGTNELMTHKTTDAILATGGAGLVNAAYSSGKPAYGVGPGNVPAYVDRSADLKHAARALISSQTFDNATICASEQAIVVDETIEDAFLREMQAQGAHWCSAEETAKLEKIAVQGGRMNPDIVGLYPRDIARMAGFEVPEDTTVLLAKQTHVGREYPISYEILTPILAWYSCANWQSGCLRCIEILTFGGKGHTLAIHATDENVIMEFALKKPAHRILVNAPTSQGAVGYATNLIPSMTLGCGSWGGNITSDNVNPRNLINIKRVAYLKQGFFENEGTIPRVGPVFRDVHVEQAPVGISAGATGCVSPYVAARSPERTFSIPGAEGSRGDQPVLTPTDIQRMISTTGCHETPGQPCPIGGICPG